MIRAQSNLSEEVMVQFITQKVILKSFMCAVIRYIGFGDTENISSSESEDFNRDLTVIISSHQHWHVIFYDTVTHKLCSLYQTYVWGNKLCKSSYNHFEMVLERDTQIFYWNLDIFQDSSLYTQGFSFRNRYFIWSKILFNFDMTC